MMIGNDQTSTMEFTSFHFAPQLRMRRRLLLAGVLILAGLGIQVATLAAFLGAVPVLLGNLLLLIKGVSNLDTKGLQFIPGDWEPIDENAVDEIIVRDRAMTRWDTNPWEVTNALGFLVLAIVVGASVFLYLNGKDTESPFLSILAVDAMVLFIPHWLTGTRSIHREQRFVQKAKLIREIVSSRASMLADLELKYLAQFAASEIKLPKDLKIKIMPREAPSHFLGLYGQVSLNSVQGTDYPYFYVVLVARKGNGMRELANGFVMAGLAGELAAPKDVEVLVIRQTTTKTSGYHTKPHVAAQILSVGIRQMREFLGG